MTAITYKKGLFRVSKNEFKGYTFIDIRRYYQDEDTEEWRPTKKGVALPLEIAKQVAEAIQKEL